MSMPPAGVEGLMDEQAVIEAEIQFELENINLDDEVQLADDFNEGNELEENLQEEVVCFVFLFKVILFNDFVGNLIVSVKQH